MKREVAFFRNKRRSHFARDYVELGKMFGMTDAEIVKSLMSEQAEEGQILSKSSPDPDKKEESERA